MPARSKQQLKFMAAAAAGKIAKVKPSVGKEFVESTPSAKSLPAKVGRKNVKSKR